jgi:hypothetical protein
MTGVKLARAVRSPGAIGNSLYSVLDVVFRDDLARSRTGHGPANTAVVRYLTFNLVRALNDKRSLKIKAGPIASPKSSMPHPLDSGPWLWPKDRHAVRGAYPPRGDRGKVISEKYQLASNSHYKLWRSVSAWMGCVTVS